jgi:hypothetical protein
MSAPKSTEQLIAELSGGLAAVQPLRPPLARALRWLALSAALAAALLLVLQPGLAALGTRLADTRLMIELGATLLTGVLAIIATFHLAIPGRAGNWVWAPLPALVLWLACSSLGCLKNGIGKPELDCFLFVLGASLPLALLLFYFMRRARPIEPMPVALLGALGVAAIGAFLLQFFHPFDVTLLDLASHAAAVAVVLAVAATIGKRALL